MLGLPRWSTSLRQMTLGSKHIFVCFFASTNVEHINKIIWGPRAVLLKIRPHRPLPPPDRSVITKSKNQKHFGIIENRSHESIINLQAVDLPCGHISWHEAHKALAAQLLGQSLSHMKTQADWGLESIPKAVEDLPHAPQVVIVWLRIF